MCKNDEAKTLDTFNKFCDNLGKYNERIGLQKKRREAASLGADAAEARQKKRREAVVDGAEAQQSSKKRRKGGGKTGRHRGKGLILFKDKNKRMTALTSQSISKRLPSRTAQKQGLDQGNILKGKRERTHHQEGKGKAPVPLICPGSHLTTRPRARTQPSLPPPSDDYSTR